MAFVLTYHDVAPADAHASVGFPGPTAARYKLTPEAFAAHLEAIAATGVEVGLLDGEGAAPRVALTFDDGGASAPTIAAMLERHGWRGHFFVTTSLIDAPGFMTSEALLELVERGHIIGSHSHTHPTYMGLLDRRSLEREWSESRARLAAILGAPPAVASVPGGFVTPAVVEAAERAGYRALLTSEPRSRPRRVGAMLVLGRYSIWSTTPPTAAAGYARGDPWAQWRLLVTWKAKIAAKRVSPRLYERARHALARQA